MAEYKKDTDKVHKVTLPSKIIQTLWGRKVASAGEKANLEVWTQFVGNGSDIQITVKDGKGSTVEKLSDKVYANKFATSVVVSDKAKESLTFTAKLPKHGLEMKSESLKVLPPRIITKAKWSQTEARRGDIVKLTAETKGILDDTEVIISIYEHDQDEAHDFITKVPARVKSNKIETEWEFEYHEDVDDIPTDEEMKKVGKSYNHPEYFFVARCGGAEAKSRLLRFKDWIEIELRDSCGNPVPDEYYVINLSNGQHIEGKLDNKGRKKLIDIPPGKFEVKLPNVEMIKKH
jgi:hypothetical protein